MTTWSLDKPGSTEDPARSYEADPAGPPSGRSATVIPFPTPLPPPWLGEDEADDCFEQVGLVAVRMLARWSLPRVLVFSQASSREEEEAGGLL